MSQVTQKATTTSITTSTKKEAGDVVGGNVEVQIPWMCSPPVNISKGVKVRSVNVGLDRTKGGGAIGGKGGKGTAVSQLKLSTISLGGISGSQQVIVKDLAVNPQQVVISREKEKLALQDLNDRFAAYIERVRFLEADNKRLQGIIAELTAKFELLNATLRGIYEAELDAARKSLDQTTAAKAVVELKVAGLEAKVAEFSALYTRECEAHAVTLAAIPKLEKMISERDSQIDYLTKNINGVEAELGRLKGQIVGLQKDLTTAKQNTDAECVARVEVESHLSTKDDEIAFITSMYEEQVKALLSIDVGSDAFECAFSNELGLALRDIRAEYEAILEASKTTDGDAWYKAKFKEVMDTTQRATGDLNLAKQELATARAKYQATMVEMAALRAQLAAANERIALLQADMAAAAAAAALSIGERDDIIVRYKASLAENLIELKALTDHKLALDAEIATYRRLLAGEENRKLVTHGGIKDTESGKITRGCIDFRDKFDGDDRGGLETLPSSIPPSIGVKGGDVGGGNLVTCPGVEVGGESGGKGAMVGNLVICPVHEVGGESAGKGAMVLDGAMTGRDPPRSAEIRLDSPAPVLLD